MQNIKENLRKAIKWLHLAKIIHIYIKIKYESFLYREALLAVSNVLENKTDCRFLTVDVYAAAVSFYDKNGFIPLNSEDVDSATRLLYFDLNDIMK